MLRKILWSFILAFGAIAFFATAETSFAGLSTALPVPDSGGTGVVRGFVSLPDEVFVVANPNSVENGGQATPNATCGIGVSGEISNMYVPFWTKRSGIIQVLYCGVLNNYDNVDVHVRALVDSYPHTGNDMQCQPSNILWDFAEDAAHGGTSCFSWICEVSNPTGCGYRGKYECPTQHNVHMECDTPNGSSAQFSYRILKVFYDKFSGSHAETGPFESLTSP